MLPPLDGLAGLTGAYSASRKLLTAYAGPFYDLVTTDANVWRDQTAAVRNLTAFSATQRPTPVAAGPFGRIMLAFDPVTTDTMIGAAVSNFITASTGYIILSLVFDVVPVVLSQIVEDTQAFFAIIAENSTVYSDNWSPGLAEQKTVSEPVNVGQPYVVEWWHGGGI